MYIYVYMYMYLTGPSWVRKLWGLPERPSRAAPLAVRWPFKLDGTCALLPALYGRSAICYLYLHSAAAATAAAAPWQGTM